MAVRRSPKPLVGVRFPGPEPNFYRKTNEKSFYEVVARSYSNCFSF